MIDQAPVLRILLLLAAVAGVTLLRWVVAKPFWGSHAGGARGYLKDVSWGAAEFLPMLAAVVALLVAAPPQGSPLSWGLLGAGFVSVFVIQRLGPFAAARKRLMDCRFTQIEKEAA